MLSDEEYIIVLTNTLKTLMPSYNELTANYEERERYSKNEHIVRIVLATIQEYMDYIKNERI